ncbi:MAG: hypothetical protein EPN36_03360 [Rhodanobacteraceae bacterium]|nr:MAG: hypothetical protein EPN36_03360 [Rhodanobacteraceae bacterium]
MNEQREGEEWQKIGAACVYLYKGPHGFALQPERFKAEILGVTAHGSVRIKAFDHVNGEWFEATVRRASLSPL